MNRYKLATTLWKDDLDGSIEDTQIIENGKGIYKLWAKKGQVFECYSVNEVSEDEFDLSEVEDVESDFIMRVAKTGDHCICSSCFINDNFIKLEEN